MQYTPLRQRPTTPALTIAAVLSVVFTTLDAPAAIAQERAMTSPAPLLSLNVPAQPLGLALNTLARQADLQMSFPATLAAGKVSAAIAGRMTVQQALARLLEGSGLAASIDDGVVVIRQVGLQERGATLLPQVDVTSSEHVDTAAGPVQGYVARRSATGMKTDTPLDEIPQSISVLGRQEMEDRSALSVIEALRYVPGVVSERNGVDTRGQDDWINLRGFSGFGTSLYQDGLRMSTDANAFANQRSEPYGLERIEVLRGPASVLYGKGDAGGVVNRVSKRPQADAVREIDVRLGNFKRRQIAADIGGAADSEGKVLYRVVGLTGAADTQDRYTNGQAVSDTRSYLAPSLTWSVTPDTSLTAFAEVLRDRNDGFAFRYTPPGASTHRSSSLLVGEPGFTGLDHDQIAFGYLVQHRINDAWSVRQNARMSRIDVAYRRISATGLQDDRQTLMRRVRAFEEQNRQLAIDTQVEGQITVAGIEHKLLFGVDAERMKTSNLTYSGDVGPLNIFTPRYGQRVTVSSTPDLDDSAQRLMQWGLYAQDQVRLTPRWLLTMGGRFDRTTMDTLDHMAATKVPQKDEKFTTRVGINYKTDSGWTPYASRSTFFLPTLGRDANAAAFQPTEGKQYEVGVKYFGEQSRSLFTAALFDLRKNNVLTTNTSDPDYQVQTGAIRSRGLELEARTAVARGVDVLANYTYNAVKVIKSNDADLGKLPIATPAHIASAWLNYRMQGGDWRGLGFGVGARHIGASYSDAANTQRAASFTVFDAAVSYDTGPWRLALNVHNLLNKEQMVSCPESVGGSRICKYGQERTVVFNARHRF